MIQPNSIQIIRFTPFIRSFLLACLLPLIGISLVGCSSEPIIDLELPQASSFETNPIKTISITVDGGLQEIRTEAATVRQLLTESGIEVAALDIVEPPLFTPLTDGLEIEIIRVVEEIESIERGIPFERRVVRNEAMSEEDDPVVLQPGQNGLEELTVQIVYQDGLEVERRVVQAVIVAEPQEEILMIGVDITSSAEIVRFGGLLAFINGGGGQIFRGSNGAIEDININGILDKRVFSLSPDGNFLLFTILDESDPDRFNRLQILETDGESAPVNLGVDNVLWADWNPIAEAPYQIAYSTGLATTFAPGWEAENIVWTAGLTNTQLISTSIQQIVDPYPATFGWWGGNYAWSPDGSQIGYSFADEVGTIDVPFQELEIDPAFAISRTIPFELSESQLTPLSNRELLYQFNEYDTRSDWVWVPNLSWSPDGRFLVFTQHGGEETVSDRFETIILDTDSGRAGPLTGDGGAGIWSHTLWSPTLDGVDQPLAFLRANDLRDTLSSSYALWLMDQDGSNARQLFPPTGVSSRFPRDPRFMIWNSVSGRDFVFVFDGDLYWYDLESEEVSQLTNDDAQAALPTWAPYGFAIDN